MLRVADTNLQIGLHEAHQCSNKISQKKSPEQTSRLACSILPRQRDRIGLICILGIRLELARYSG